MNRFLKPIYAQLNQGANPQGLALTCAWGAMIAIFPILGSTTALCVLIGIRMKLNQPILQAVNYVLYPVQLILLPLFIEAGARITGSESISFQPKVVIAQFTAEPVQFMSHYGVAGLHAILVWALLAPWMGWIIYQLCLRLFQRIKTA